jgi:predicted ribonuclease YlaK
MPERYILDTSAILEHPEVLAAIAPNRIVIPKAVLEELERTKLRGTGGLLRQSLEATIKNGARIPNHPSTEALTKIAEDPRARSLAGADLSIAALAFEYSSRMGPKAVVVVTRDRALVKFLESEGVKAWTIAQFLTDKALNQRDEKIEALTKDLVRRQRQYLLLSLVMGILAVFIGNLAFAHIRAFVDAFHIWGCSSQFHA